MGYLWGVDLYNAGFYWEAHEEWETLWRAAVHDRGQRAYLQGLILCAAACLKGVMQDADAARRIGARASERFAEVQAAHGAAFMGLDLARFDEDFRAFVAADPSAVERRPRLVLAATDARALA